MSLELHTHPLRNGLVLHQAGRPEEQAWTIECVAAAGAKLWTIQAGGIVIHRRKSKARGIDVVDGMAVCAFSIVNDAIREGECG